MANRSCLFADNDPRPLRYEGEGAEVSDGAVFICGCAYQVPVLWLFCFDPEDLTLAERENRARSLFPEHAEVWDEFVEALNAIEPDHLKVEMGEIWCLMDGDELRRQLAAALDWVAGRSRTGLDELLSLAGVERYDQ